MYIHTYSALTEKNRDYVIVPIRLRHSYVLIKIGYSKCTMSKDKCVLFFKEN